MCLRSDVQDVLGRTGVTIRHVSADGYGPAADIEIRPGGQGETVLEDVRVGGGVNGDPARAGIAVFGDPGDVTRIEDGGVVSTTGISVQGGTVVVRRTWIYAEASGIEVRSGSVYASSLPITAYADARAVAVTGSAGPAAADLRQVTVTGTDRGGDSTGVLVGGGPHPARADILATDLLASPAVATAIRVQPGGQAAVAYSNFHATTGPVEDRGGNIDSPGVPIHRTALIDHGGTTPLGAAESQTDRLGRPRITDGDADGVPARDIGDREFQPAHLVLTGSAPVAQVGQRVTFDASASTFGDIPGYNPYQGIRNFGAYYWDLDGDGSFETLTNAPTATFVYSTTGVRTVRLRGNGSFFGHYDGPAPQVAYTQVVIDTIAPTLSASVTPAPLPRFRLRVSEPARVEWKLQRRTRGRWKSAGTFTRRVRRGTSRVPLPARVQRAKVKSGSYRATLVATDRAGNRSRVRPLGFVVAP
jgi:hypothetical protein